MKIGAIGYNYPHDSSFVMDRPNGPGCHLLVFVKTPSYFEINGQPYDVKPNSFVMFSADTPCLYRAKFDTYTDDWMYFEADEAEMENFRQLGIPENEIVFLGEMEELSQLMHIIACEFYSALIYRDETVKHYTDILMLKLARAINSGCTISPDLLAERNHKFTQLRSVIFTRPDEVPTIDQMALDMGMSRSGFQHLYKKLFGVSVMNDVINGRLDRAKRLLSSTKLTVREIAEKCGYNNEYNFMRQFKSRFGKTPSEYRKML